jgi:hypothetical protein
MALMDRKAHTQVMEWKTHSRHKEVMLRDTVDGEFTTTQGVARAALRRVAGGAGKVTYEVDYTVGAVMRVAG